MVYLPLFTYIYHKFDPNVGKDTIHGSYGIPLVIRGFLLKLDIGINLIRR